MGEAVLAYTVHHKGRKYLAGTNAAQIGAVASEIGDHAWVGGKGPGKVEGGGDPGASTPAGTSPEAQSPLGGTPPVGGEGGDPGTPAITDGQEPAAPAARASRRGTR